MVTGRLGFSCRISVVGVQEGIAILPAIGNVALALLGNFIGGGVLIGLYYAYLNDEEGWLRKHPDKITYDGEGQS